MSAMTGRFVWHELMTSDLDAAEAFYAKVVGWQTRDAGMPGMRYTLGAVGPTQVAGLMTIPDEAKANGMAPVWFGYVAVPDVDAAAASVAAKGGTVHRPPMDIPNVGRFAVVADPQGAVFNLFSSASEPPPAPPPGTPGLAGWNELLAADWAEVWPFYVDLFGWEKAMAVDMGPMGTYQLFAAGGQDVGGMMTKMDQGRPRWQFYFNVDDIDAAHARLTGAGGTALAGPHEVPGGLWTLNARDPQGAVFALVGARKAG